MFPGCSREGACKGRLFRFSQNKIWGGKEFKAVTSLVGFGDVFRYGLGYDDMTCHVMSALWRSMDPSRVSKFQRNAEKKPSVLMVVKVALGKCRKTTYSRLRMHIHLYTYIRIYVKLTLIHDQIKTGTIPLSFKGVYPKTSKNYPVNGPEILQMTSGFIRLVVFSTRTSTGVQNIFHQRVPEHIDSNMSNEKKKKTSRVRRCLRSGGTIYLTKPKQSMKFVNSGINYAYLYLNWRTKYLPSTSAGAHWFKYVQRGKKNIPSSTLP